MRNKALKALLALLACCLFPAAHGAALEWKPETSLTCGSYTTFAIKSDGTVWAWGKNSEKDLGIGSEASSQGTPLQVIGLSDVVRVSAWSRFLALKSDGTVWEWGTTPVLLPELSDIIAISEGKDWSMYYRLLYMALKQDGTVLTWGDNKYGQLGNGDKTITKQNKPSPSLMTDAIAIAAGETHCIAIKSDRTVWAWGNNEDGQLGNGTTENSFSPVQVSGLSDIIAVSTFESTNLALDENGTVWAWGNNTYGTVGDGTEYDRKTPVKVKNLSDVSAISAGEMHSMALKKDGTVWAWGCNAEGALGIGTSVTFGFYIENQLIPVQVRNMEGVTAIAAGRSFSAAVKQDGSFWAWGYNSSGQIGDNFYTYKRNLPAQILTNVQSVAAGWEHVVAVTPDHKIWVWGHNEYGQLGDNSETGKNAPTMLNLIENGKQYAAGPDHTLCLKTDGTVWAWGSNETGQLGNTTVRDSLVPIQTANLTDVQMIAADKSDRYLNSSSFAVKADGSLWAWGNNGNGQLGDGSTEKRTEPVEITGISGIRAIAGGYGHSIALKNDNTVWTWGSNNNYQLGREGNTLIPGQVPNLTDVSLIAAGSYHCAAVQSGSVWTWGDNYYGQLGDGTKTDRSSPVQVPGISDVAAVAAGDSHTLALKNDGTVWGWGYNRSGELGDGTFINRESPVQVIGLSGVTAVTANGYFSIALKQDGTLWTWGSNVEGQIGDGTAWMPSQTLGREGKGFFNIFPKPAGRKDYTLAYFPPLNRVILHGGWTSPDWQEMNDLWKLDETGKWSELVLESAPAFSQHSMTYDSDREVMILCGKKQPASFETYEFAGTLWTKKTDTATAAHGDVEIAYDPDRTFTVLYAGQKDVIPETWEYDGYSWNKKNPAHSPPGFDHGASLRYDEKNKKTVLVGYEETLKETQTWTWNGTDWTRISGQQPANSLFGSMAYDSERQNMVFLTTDMKTWIFDGTKWTLLSPVSSPAPAPLSNFTLAWHPVLKLVLFFGGEETSAARSDPVYPDKIWAWNGVFWSEYPGVAVSAVIGDLNNDGAVTLADVILALRICAGIPAPELRPGYSSSGADVNGNGVAGIEEALYGMGKLVIAR